MDSVPCQPEGVGGLLCRVAILQEKICRRSNGLLSFGALGWMVRCVLLVADVANVEGQEGRGVELV